MADETLIPELKGYTYRFHVGFEEVYECDTCGALVTYGSHPKHDNQHKLLSVLINSESHP